MKKILMLVCVLVILVSFFMPWVSVESSALSSINKLIGSDKKAEFTSISGYQVPVLANSNESKLMITIIKIFQPSIKDADKKSYLIWAVPLLSVVMFLLSMGFNSNKWVKLGIAVLGIAIFAVAVFKITTTNLDKVVLKINIAYGLWILLYGYLAIGILELVDFFKLLKQKA